MLAVYAGKWFFKILLITDLNLLIGSELVKLLEWTCEGGNTKTNCEELQKDTFELGNLVGNGLQLE